MNLRPVSEAHEVGRIAVVPELLVRRGREAIAFYERAFGAVEVYRVGGTEDDPDVVAQLAVGDASFWVSDEAPASANFSPESLGGGRVRVLVMVEDPHALVERAKAAGAREVYPVAEQHGWLVGRIEDPFGHHWEIGKPLIPWPLPTAVPVPRIGSSQQPMLHPMRPRFGTPTRILAAAFVIAAIGAIQASSEDRFARVSLAVMALVFVVVGVGLWLESLWAWWLAVALTAFVAVLGPLVHEPSGGWVLWLVGLVLLIVTAVQGYRDTRRQP